MSSDTIRVNFGRPMPLFPLSSASLMPQGILPLNIFEPRYLQMVRDALDNAGQIAVAMFQGDGWKHEHDLFHQYQGRPELRPATCVGQIIQHVKLADGRYAIMLQGVCRARILREIEPDGEKLYREAMLEPFGIEMGDEDQLAPYRAKLKSALERKPLSDLRNAEQFVQHLSSDDVPTCAIVELLGLTFLNDDERRYRLLELGDPEARAEMVARELGAIERMLKRAAPQRAVDAPKGVYWN